MTETRYSNGIMPEDITTTYEHITTTERSVTIFPNGNSTEYLYDKDNSNPKAKGNLLEVRRKASGLSDIVISYTYETHYNQVKTSIDAKGKTTIYYYDWEEIQNSTDYNGDSQLGPDHGNVVKIEYPNVTQPASQTDIYSTFVYNQNGQITDATDPLGIVTHYEYYTTGASTGYLKKVTRNYGQTPSAETEYTYDSVGNITSIKDARGHTTEFLVNELNQVTTTTARAPNAQQNGYQSMFHYDVNDYLSKIEIQNIDENGDLDSNLPWISVDYSYDILGNLQTKTEVISSSLNAVTSYSYDNNDNLIETTQPESNVRHTTYDERDMAYQITDGYGSSNPLFMTNYYDNNGNKIRVETGNGAKGTVTYEYDGFDRRKKAIDALGNYIITEYDNNSNVTRSASFSSSDQKLRDVYFYYDELNRMYKTIAKKFDTPGGSETDVVTTFWFDKKGRRTKIVDNNSKETITAYDNLNRITTVTDPLNNQISYQYDNNGNPLTVTKTEYPGPTTYITTNEYDNLDRLISSTNWTGTILHKYDSRNNLKYYQDRENHVTRRNYDGMNRLKENIYELTPTGVITVKYGLDKNGRIVSVTDDNNHTTNYGYDEVNRRTSEILPDSSHNAYIFNQYDVLDGTIDNNGTGISYTYNAGLQVSQKDIIRANGIEGTTKETFSYDGINRMTEATNYDGYTQISQVSMQYDSLGNLLQENQGGKTVSSQYNAIGFRTKLTYPGSKEISFVPDDINRIYQITDAVPNVIAQYAYAGQARVTGRSYKNGTNLNVSYDGGMRATDYIHSLDAVTITGFAYHFDKEDNKLYEKRLFENKGEAFKYDAIYRLTGIKYGVTTLSPSSSYEDYTTYDNIEEFNLDGVGNRLNVYNGVTTTYTTNSLNQYTGISGTNLTYDTNGNLTDDGTNTYIYDYANRLLKVTYGEQVLAEYKYDTLGRRFYKKAWDGETNVETNFYYDGIRCIEEQSITGTIIAEYVFGNGIDEILQADYPITCTQHPIVGNFYYHENSLGSIYAITDESGNVIERYRYNAYGETTFLDGNGNVITESIIGNRIMFTGREYDLETGLYYYRARYYSVEMGRFLQRDVVSVEMDLLSLYTYASNNPIGCSDPTGLTPWTKRVSTDESISTLKGKGYLRNDFEFKGNKDSKGDWAKNKELMNATIKLQNELNDAGYPVGTVDGKWGSITQAALELKNFDAANSEGFLDSDIPNRCEKAMGKCDKKRTEQEIREFAWSEFSMLAQVVFAEFVGEPNDSFVPAGTAAGWIVRNRTESNYKGAENYIDVITAKKQFSSYKGNNWELFENRKKLIEAAEATNFNALDNYKSAWAIAKDVYFAKKVPEAMQGALWYYSPQGMKPKGSVPAWVDKSVEQVEIPGIEKDSDVIRAYRKKK